MSMMRSAPSPSIPLNTIGVADRVGSLEEGKDADIVIMDGTPFTVEGVVKHVFIDGEEI